MGGKVGRFEDLEVWKEGMRLVTKIYRYYIKVRKERF